MRQEELMRAGTADDDPSRAPDAADAGTPVPLCVDLDGTLVLSDTLAEGVLALAWDRRLPGCIAGLITAGRAGFKHLVAEAADLDVTLLPFNQDLLGYLRAQQAAGRTLVLATAADAGVAHAIARHLGLFDEVIASDGMQNLKGEAKARALVARFGEKGFAYAGDSPADLPVWQAARHAVIVNARPSLSARVRGAVDVEAEFGRHVSRLRGWLQAMRPHQWVKNILVFVPILTAHALGQVSAWTGAMLMMIAFSATASSIYIVNDLLDLAADRQHPRKRRRPFAAGTVPLQDGVVLSLLLLCAGLTMAALGGPGTLVVILVYATVSVAYSLSLKRKPLVDVFTLAALYTARLVGGGEATGHQLSLWLLGFSSFLFLSLALMKRVQELLLVGAGRAARRGYMAADLTMLTMFGCASAFAASVVLALFVQSETVSETYRTPFLLWGIVPLVLFWQCRLWLSTGRGYMRDDPIVYAARDWVSWLVAAASVTLMVAAQSIIIPHF